MITVWSATEGSGCTSLAVNLADEIGRLRNAPCLLAEGAIGFGRLASYLGLTPQETLADLVRDIDHVDVERVRRAVTKIDDNLHVLTGSYASIAPVDMTSEKVLLLLSYAKQLGDVVVIDGRPNFEQLDFDFVNNSQQLVLVAQQSFASIYGLKRIMELLAQRECLAQQYVVINRYLPNVKEFSIRSLKELLGIPKVFPVANDYTSFQAAEIAGKTLRNTAPHSRSLADITALARAMLGMPAEPPRVGQYFRNSWNRVAHSLNLK